MATATDPHIDASTLANTAVVPAKRKHENGDLTNGTHPTQQQIDILEVLRQRDITPAFLDHEFKDGVRSEPASKRAKVSAATVTTISEKLKNNQYRSLEDLASDAARVSEDIIGSVRSQDTDKDRPTVDLLKQIQRIRAMRQFIEEVALRETHNNGAVAVKQEEGALQVKAEQNEDFGAILTLFGHAPTAKQLFSSLQSQQPSLRIEELSLPNGITTTNIKPSSTASREKALTFAEAFAPPSSLPPLSAPKAYKRPSTRDNDVTWEFKDHTRNSKRGGYTTAPLTVGDWLSYGGGNKLSAREKRKQRNRALSDADTPLTDSAAELEKQEDALFQQAYSSYAPAYDNSKSLVDTSIKSLVWWHKIGHKRYNSRFALDPALSEASAVAAHEKEESVDDSGFAQAVEDYVEPEEYVDHEYDGTVDETLAKISALLESLAGLQEIRNASAPGSTLATKLPLSPAPSLTSHSGTADEPSKDELKAYHEAQREIATLILTLPPYAVAKLKVRQLADLGVSRVITFETSNYKGQMEEDQAAKIAKYNASAAAAANVASLSRSTSAANPHYSSTSRTPAIGQSANTRYGQAAYGSRTPAAAPVPQRNLTGQNFSTPTAQGSQFTQGQFARSGASAMQQTFTQTNGQLQQRAQPTSYNYNGNFQNTQTPRPNYASQQAAPQFQPRSQMAAANAINYQTNITTAPTASMSPAKNVQPNSGRGTPVNFISPAQTPVNGLQTARAPPPLIPRASSGTPQPQVQQLSNGHV